MNKQLVPDRGAILTLLAVSLGLMAWSGVIAEDADTVGDTDGNVAVSDSGCPWKISGIAVEKWANGSVKRAMRAKGSFPINIPGVTERPDWYVNGIYVGKSKIFFNLRSVFGGEYLKDKEQNTVTVKFTKPPYAGQSDAYSFYYDASKVAPGGQKWF